MIFKSKKTNTDWGILNCQDGSMVKVDGIPFLISTESGADLRVSSNQGIEAECLLYLQKDGHIKATGNGCFNINEEPVEEMRLEPNTDYSLRFENTFYLLRGDFSLADWVASIDLSNWGLVDEKGEQVGGPWILQDAFRFAQQKAASMNTLYGIFPYGAGTAFSFSNSEAAVSNQRASLQNEAAPLSEGDLRCPNCWLAFEHCDIMHISSHEELIGDPLLGEDVAQRFLASRFDADGNALDPMGLPSMGTACPHCHSELPSDFIDTNYQIISLVGNASAGKSYYLSVLSRILPRTMIKKYGLSLQDADPTSNAPLTEMRSRLFGGGRAEDAALDKTVLGGGMYRDVYRFGRFVKMPRPFSFTMDSNHRGIDRGGVIFFDNAGEHFQPGVELHESPGALHVASAAGIIFLFDPLRNLDFRSRLKGHDDPQLSDPMNDVQAVILSEMRNRISRVKGLSFEGRIDTPFAFVVGKFDAWAGMIKDNSLKDYFTADRLSVRAVEENSEIIRNLLMDLCPELVANAESLSTNVRYFPVSSFGHTPVATGGGRIAPIPEKLKPIHVEVPALWLFQQLYKGFELTAE